MSLPKSIFVWTLDDVIGLAFLGLLLLVAGLLGIGKLWDKFHNWRRQS